MSKQHRVTAYERDEKGRRTKLLKSAWKKKGKFPSLKQFAKENPELGTAWRANKLANGKSPLKKIGRTRKRVKSGGGPKKQDPKP